MGAERIEVAPRRLDRRIGRAVGRERVAVRVAAAMVVAMALLAACGDDESGSDSSTVLETRSVMDLEYHPMDERFTFDSGLIDVIAPTEGGPWPTVVVFHGDGGPGVSKQWHRSDATAIAERGRVVFLPAWGDLAGSGDAEGLAERGELSNQEVSCAVAFAAATTSDYGGDPDRLVLYGLSGGGNAVLMAGLGDQELLDTCVTKDAATVDALVPIDVDWLLGGGWDQELQQDPEAFYAMTPWRHLDGIPNVPIHVMVAGNLDDFDRPVGADPGTSWLSYRHPDIDLVADLENGGYLDDEAFGLEESGEYAYGELLEAGYDAHFIVVPGATHTGWSAPESLEMLVDTVLHAEQD